MQRTYKSKKETAGAIDPRDVLLTRDAKSSVFDAFSIQNIKQTKRDLSVGSTMQFATSNKVGKRKHVNRLKEQDALCQPKESTSRTAFLSPNKPFCVDKASYLFDQLLKSSCNKDEPHEPGNLLRKQPAIQQKTETKKKSKKYRRIVNYSDTDSSDSDKEIFDSREGANKMVNISNIKSHKLVIEKETKPSSKYIDESINNLSIFTPIRNQKVETPKNENYKLTKHAQSLQTSPLCSTPLLGKYRGTSIYKFSPISRNLNDSSQCGTAMEDSHDYDTHDITHKEKNKIYKIGKKQNCTEAATFEDKIEQSIVSKKKIESNTINENNTTAASIVYDTIDETGKTAIQSPIFLIKTTKRNKRETRKLATCLSYLQTTEKEPFHGFEDIEFIGNNKLDPINNKYMEIENTLVDKSYTIPSPTRLSCDSTFVNINQNIMMNKNIESFESNISSAAGCSNSESFYDPCRSDNSIEEQVQNIEPIVKIERLSDSVFDKYYSQMADYSVESHYFNTSSDSNDYATVRVSDNVSNKSSNNSIISENTLEENNFKITIVDDENNASIGSNEIDYNDNSIECKPEDVSVSFVTIRRRNEFRNVSFKGLDNSIVSASSHEFDNTVHTNKNSLEYNNYVMKEHIVDNINGSFKLEKEIDENGKEYKYSISDSADIFESDLSLKAKNILTRKSVRGSIKAHKYKAPIHKKLPETEDYSDGSLSIKAEEIDENENQYNFSINESDEITEAKLIPKTKKIITRKIARESSNARKYKSPINNRVSKIKENADNSVNIVTRKTSRIYRDSIATDSQNSTGYEVNMGNGSISCDQPGIILQPGKKWRRSLSVHRRSTTMDDHLDQSTLEEEQNKVRKYGQTTLEMQGIKGSFHNDSINSCRSTFVSKPSRSTKKIVRESTSSRASLCSTIVCEDLEEFLGEDCDDTIVELSKLSIADSQHEVTIIEKFHDTSNRSTTARDYVLRRCNQADVLPFDECYPDPVLKNCRKIGEGVYGEVFLWRAGDGRARVLKVIPIAENIKVNGEQQKDFHEIISEIVIAMELSALRAPIADIEQHLNEGKSLETLDLHSVENATDAFNEVLRVRCVSGSYPSRLQELWDLYDECRGSENDSPALLPAHQQYIVLELGNAGQDLESYQFRNAEQSYALFKQIAFGLAVAEEAYQFEHRDLHWGNVLIAPTEEKFASFVVRGRLHRVRSAGVRACVIDYSLSRATLGRCALYNDLATDEALFDAFGDYQFQLYRLMRDKLGNDWKNFEPYTNVLWLHYIVDKMITALRYTRTNTKIHKHYINKLKVIKNRILDYGSAIQYVLTDNEL